MLSKGWWIIPKRPPSLRWTRDTLTIYELRLHPDDVGKVIGRQGITINAIRSLLLAGSAKKGLRCTMEIVEDKPRPQ
jgi:predicted RNA-binding protein YlqC (UPF0109 family)